MNLNYENVKIMKNLMEISFLKEDINQILNSNDVNKKLRKIMSIYDVMIGKNTKVINIDEIQNEKNQEKFKDTNVNNNFENKKEKNFEKSKIYNSTILSKDQFKKSTQSSEITLKVKIEQKDLNKNIYFLGDTQGSDGKQFN